MNFLKAAMLWFALAMATVAHAQFQFSENNGTLTVTGYGGPDTAVTIPSTNTDGELVTGIGSSAFVSYASALTSVTIPDSITNIGTGAFLVCGNLTNVTIIGHGLVSLNLGAFIYCTALTTITLPSSVTTLGDSVFLNSGLTHITLPGSLATTGKSTFSGCTNLVKVIVSPGIVSIGGGCFQSCLALTNVSIPNGVTNIAGSAFLNCASLTNLTIPAGLTNIGTTAFSGCSNLAALYFKGDAPDVATNSFGSISNLIPAICYYLPGTAGWNPTLAGIPTRLWDPQVQRLDGFFGVRTNQFGFNITASTNLTVTVQGATDLLNGNWQPLQTLTLSNGSAYFSDSKWTNHPVRFYRLSAP